MSSVTQGIDNEINAMRSTLLIELERFEGVAVFATNFAKNYDSAFVSRIRYHTVTPASVDWPRCRHSACSRRPART